MEKNIEFDEPVKLMKVVNKPGERTLINMEIGGRMRLVCHVVSC